MSFKRANLRNQFLVGELSDLLGRESNEKGAILDAIASLSDTHQAAQRALQGAMG
jgi:hypothetical protein